MIQNVFSNPEMAKASTTQKTTTTLSPLEAFVVLKWAACFYMTPSLSKVESGNDSLFPT